MLHDPILNSNDEFLNQVLDPTRKSGSGEILELFPQIISLNYLDPDPDVFDGMLQFMRKFDEQSRETKRKRESQDPGLASGMAGKMDGNAGASDSKPTQLSASTGDVEGMGAVSGLPEFEWLTSEIEKCVVDYAERFDIDTSLISFFHQKSWPVVTRADSMINSHAHPNAHISAVYYLNDIQKGEGGNLIFMNPNPGFFSGHIVGEKIYKNNRTIRDGVRPSKNMLVVFPSNLTHFVSQFSGKENRFSVSFDFFLTTAKSVDPGRSENIIPDPSHWSRFNQQPSDSS